MRDFRDIKSWEKSHQRFMEIGMGSGSELEYQLLLSSDLDYLAKDTY